MEKGNLKTGQLLDIKEKRGKLVREYVAGFFGDEPIIKQRLLTPQEARIYREDLAKGRKAGRTESEARQEASGVSQGAPAQAAAPKKRLVRRGEGAPKKKLVRRRPAQNGVQPEAAPDVVAQPVEGAEVSATATPEITSAYVPAEAKGNREFVQSVIDSETEKANFDPSKFDTAVHLIDRIGYPGMKIYRVGAKDGEEEGEFYTQKEYIARQTLGLPIWKAKPAATEESNEAPQA